MKRSIGSCAPALIAVLGLLAAARCAAGPETAPPDVRVAIDIRSPGPAIPEDFAGLSFETSQMLPDAAGRRYFSPENRRLVALFRALGVRNLRIGGNSADNPAVAIPGHADIDALFEFARKAPVRVIYTLRLKQGDPKADAETAAYIMSRHASEIACFSIGNEPSIYDKTYESYAPRLKTFAEAVLAAAPNSVFCGPSTHARPEWARRLANDFGRRSRFVLITQHGYPGGSARKVADPAVGRDRMLSQKWLQDYGRDCEAFAPDVLARGLPYRIEEANSYFNGGLKDASDTFAAALWALDYLHWWASRGAAGVNFHTGDTVAAGDRMVPSRYAAYRSSPGGYFVCPVGYALKAFDLGGRGHGLPASVVSNPGNLNLTAYADRGADGSIMVTLINKEHGDGARPATVELDAAGGLAGGRIIAMTAPGSNVAATDGLLLGGAAIAEDASWKGRWTDLPPAIDGKVDVAVPPASAAIVRVEPLPSSDFRSLISASDLDYSEPASRSEEGMPVGNGRMGSLVWTTPTALHFQINRTDVFAENGATRSFPERNSDYSAGCGAVDVNLVDYGEDVFAGDAFRQHLSVYDGLMTASGKGVTARVVAWPERDVMAVEVDDERAAPSPISVDLRMLRYAIQYIPRRNAELAKSHTVLIQQRNQTAASQLDIRDGRIVLEQRFREGGYSDSSAVAIGIVGRSSQARYASDSAVRLTAAPGTGKFTILIASAATFDPKADPAGLALAPLDAAADEGFGGLEAATAAWWRDFWSQGFVRLHSADGEADFVQWNYNAFLYAMGASSRGDFPPRFAGMIWETNGDMQEWGSQFWWNNMDCDYGGLLPDGRGLVDPLFSMYTGMYAASERAARQQWGAGGIYIPETVFFDGLPALPDDIASEMRDLYLGRKPWEQRSAEFMRYAETGNPNTSRWNWIDHTSWVDGHWDIRDRGAGPHGPVVHLFHSGAKIAHLYWQRYQYTMDSNWLRDRAYPMLKGIAEFYRTYPLTEKGADGLYHIHDVNNSEGIWGGTDTLEDTAAMHGILPAAIRASELLGVDADLRAAWREFLAHLAPLPTDGKGRWVVAHAPVLHGTPDRPELAPAVYFDLCSVASADSAMVRAGLATYASGGYWRTDRGEPGGPVGPDTSVSELNRIATAAAHLGRGEDLRYLLPNQIRSLDPEPDFCDWEGVGKVAVLKNRMTLREGPGAIEVERLGRIARGVNEGLLQSEPDVPGGDPVIWVFPAWPTEWDADFSLLARGAFVVNSSIRQGSVRFVELLSRAGSDCRLHNPWGGAAVLLKRNGAPAETLRGTLLAFPTRIGERIRILPAP